MEMEFPNIPRGTYRCKILRADHDGNTWHIYADIAVGHFAGIASDTYAAGLDWPINWTIWDQAEMPIKCLLYAAGVTRLKDIVGKTVAVDIDCYGNVTRSHPAKYAPIAPADIRLGTDNWAKGSPDERRATHIAALSGLPVLIADAQERKSPMVQWAADHGIAILPQSCMSGDYTIEGSAVVVDRKASVEELWEDMVPGRKKRASYDAAASRCLARGKQLVYVVASPEGCETLDDIAAWSYIFHPKNAKTPDKTYPHYGVDLVKWIKRQMLTCPNVSLVFCPSVSDQCNTIWQLLNS